MPRHARLDVPGTLHHVMARGIEGTAIFVDDADRLKFLRGLEDLSAVAATRILAWSLMRNHFHLLLFSGPQGLPSFMRKLMTGYAVHFNRRHHRSGHLFQNRYKSIVCEEEPYLLELIRYIHLNPLRAKAVNSLEELDTYPWCGHSALMGRILNNWQDRKYALDNFSTDNAKAVLLYREFVSEARDRGKRPELTGGGLVRSGLPRVASGESNAPGYYDARILGSNAFVNQVRGSDRKEKYRETQDRDVRIKAIIAQSCRDSGIHEEQIINGSRSRIVSKTRARLAHSLVNELGMPITKIAPLLGVSISAVANALKKGDGAYR
jgi:putative transposase